MNDDNMDAARHWAAENSSTFLEDLDAARKAILEAPIACTPIIFICPDCRQRVKDYRLYNHLKDNCPDESPQYTSFLLLNYWWAK